MARQGETVLRKFKDFDDLFDNVENEQIVAWLNEYAAIKPRYEKLQAAEEKRTGYHKVYQERKKISMKLLEERMDPDELARIKQLAEETVAAKEGEK
jgi:hypothetical protein